MEFTENIGNMSEDRICAARTRRKTTERLYTM